MFNNKKLVYLALINTVIYESAGYLYSYEFAIIFLFFLSFITFIIVKKVTIGMPIIIFLIYLFFNNYDLDSFDPIKRLRQIIYIILLIYIYHSLFKYNTSEYILKCYVYFCTILSLFGLLQFVFGQFLNFNFYIKQALYEKSEFGLSLYRVTSIFSEPSHFGTYLCPAVIILIYGHNFIKFHHQKYLLLINTAALILSQSLNSFLLFLIYLFVFEIKKTKSQKQYSNIYQRMIIFTVITSAFIYLGLVDKSFQFSSDVSFRNENISGTSGLYFTTIQVLQDQLLLHPFFGFGLGNFNYAFNLTFQYLNPFQIETSDFSGTSSGWGKILVETGIIGFSFFIYFLFFGIKRNKSNDIFRFMNQISLIYIIFVLIRYGGFTPNIFFFMIASYTTSHYSAYESKYEALNSK